MDAQDRDRFSYGYDAGNIVDGVVGIDLGTGEHTLVDDEGVVFFPSKVLDTLIGKKVRITIISLEALGDLEKIYEKAVQ